MSHHPNLNNDMFVSRLNHHLSTCCAWKADSGSWYTDIFSFEWNNHNFYVFPPFSLLSRCVQKFQQHQAGTDCIILAETNLVSSPPEAFSGSVRCHQTEERLAQASVAQPTTSTSHEPDASVVSCVREYFRRMQIPADVKQVLMACLRKGTQKQYSMYFQNGLHFVMERQVDYLAQSLNDALNFLFTLYNTGRGYSTLNTTR